MELVERLRPFLVKPWFPDVVEISLGYRDFKMRSCDNSVFLLASLGLLTLVDGRFLRTGDFSKTVCGDLDCVVISNCPSALKLANKVPTSLLIC